MAHINADQLAVAIMQDLEIYAQNTVRDVEYAVNKVAKLAEQELKDTSPVGPTGEYAKSWSNKKWTGRGKDYYARVAYSKAPHYRLTHLLEKPHRAVDGSFVAARPHIKQVEQKAQRWMYDLLTARLSGRRTR